MSDQHARIGERGIGQRGGEGRGGEGYQRKGRVGNKDRGGERGREDIEGANGVREDGETGGRERG